MNGLQDITFFVIGTYSGRILGFLVKPEVDWFFGFVMGVRSCGKNSVTIGRMVLELLRFSFFGTYFRPPSWISVQTGSGLLFGLPCAGAKLL